MKTKTKHVHLRVRQHHGGQETRLIELSTGRCLLNIHEPDYEEGDDSRLDFLTKSAGKGIPTYMLDCKDSGFNDIDVMPAVLNAIRQIERWRRAGERKPENLFQMILAKGEKDRKPQDYGIELRYSEDEDAFFPGDDPDEEGEDEEEDEE